MGRLDWHDLGSLQLSRAISSEVCLSPAALRDPHAQSRGLSGVVPSSLLSASQGLKLLPRGEVT